MANTSQSTYKGNFITVTFTGTGADWDFSTDTNVPAEIRTLGRMRVNSISFIRYGASDKGVILETSSGPELFISDGSGTDKQIYEDGKWMRPFIDISAGTYYDISQVKYIFELV